MSNFIGKSLGRYYIIEQLGQGGMAVVYKAYDRRLERNVAIKFIRTDRLSQNSGLQYQKRFEREAKALARLNHPNIIPIIDYGIRKGISYLVMPFIPGGTLKEKLEKEKRIPWQQAAKLLLPIAQALSYAHEEGILHRDVKPSNILIAKTGQPILTDFGVAKILGAGETQDLTNTGMGIGTPEYMAPEQFRGKTDDRTDIYALGVVFYEMITGRKPYTADTPAAVAIKQVTEPLPRPSFFVRDLPRDVEQVLLKALAKDPKYRYPRMREFARALERLANGNIAPAKSRRAKKKGNVSITKHGLLWGMGIFLGLILLGGTVFLGYRAKGQLQITTSTKQDAASPSAPSAWTPSTVPPSPTPPLSFTPTPDLSPRESFPEDLAPEGALARLGKGTITDIAYSPYQETLVVGSSLGIWVYDADTFAFRKFIPTDSAVIDVVLAQDAPILAMVTEEKYNELYAVSTLDIENEEVLTTFQLSTTRWHLGELAISPDGSVFATNERYTIVLLDTQSGERLHTIKSDLSLIQLAFSPSGEVLAGGASEGKVFLWDVQTGNLSQVLRGMATGYVQSIAFSWDGSMLVGEIYQSQGYSEINVWDTSNNSRLHNIDLWIHGGISNITFSPDGKTIAGIMNGNVVQWDILTEEQIHAFPSSAFRLQFLSDGSLLASSASVVQSIDPQAGKTLRTLDGFWENISKLAFSKDGKTLIVVTKDMNISFWDVSEKTLLRSTTGTQSDVADIAFSPDRSMLALTTWDRDKENGSVILWDTENNTRLRTLIKNTKYGGIAFSPDGSLLAGAFSYKDYVVRIWNTSSGEHIKTLVSTNGRSKVAFSSDGSLLAASTWYAVRIWDTKTWQAIQLLEPRTDGISSLAFSPIQNILASGGDNGTILLWDAQRGQQLRPLTGHTGCVTTLAFSPDGSILASGGKGCYSNIDKEYHEDFRIILWDVTTGKQLKILEGHTGDIVALAFSPDGSLLASASEDDTVILWDMSQISP